MDFHPESYFCIGNQTYPPGYKHNRRGKVIPAPFQNTLKGRLSLQRQDLMTVNIVNLVGSIINHQDTALDLGGIVLLELTEVGRTPVAISSAILWTAVLHWMKRKELAEGIGIHFPVSWLHRHWTSCCRLLQSWHLHHNGLHPQTVSQHKPHFPSSDSVSRCQCNETKGN